MNNKIKGLLILVVVIAIAGAYQFIFKDMGKTDTINGYLGGEKIGLLEDQEVIDIMKKKHHLAMNYAKAGSLDMIKADQKGMNYLFPSSQTALDMYLKQYGKPKQAEVVFNTPIVLYTRRIVADALVDKGYAQVQNGVHTLDMVRFTQLLEEGKNWDELGLTTLYGKITVSTTDPTKSNSGNMFAGLLANMVNQGNVVDESTVGEVAPKVVTIFNNLGYMESSSADLFDQFLKTGVGAKPIMAGYESQILEFAVEKPDAWAQIKDDIVILYPIPTVWSSHVYIALDEQGQRGLEALRDPDIQKLAWEKHGFRTGVYTAQDAEKKFNVSGVKSELTQIIRMPDSKTMDYLINALN